MSTTGAIKKDPLEQTKHRSNSSPPSPIPPRKETETETKVVQVVSTAFAEPRSSSKNASSPIKISQQPTKLSKSSQSKSTSALYANRSSTDAVVKIPESPSHTPSKADTRKPLKEEETQKERKRVSETEVMKQSSEPPKGQQKKLRFLSFLRPDKNTSTEKERFTALVNRLQIPKPSSLEWHRSLGKKAAQFAAENANVKDKKAARKSNSKLLDETALNKECKDIVAKFKNEALSYTKIPERINEFLGLYKDSEFDYLKGLAVSFSPVIFIQIVVELHKDKRELVKEIIGGEGIYKLIGQFNTSANDNLWMESVSKGVYMKAIRETYPEICELKDPKPNEGEWVYQLTKGLESEAFEKIKNSKEWMQQQAKLKDELLAGFDVKALAFTTIPSRIQEILETDHRNNQKQYQFLKPFCGYSPKKFIAEWKKIQSHKAERYYLQELIGGEEILKRVLSFDYEANTWKNVIEATFRVQAILKENLKHLFVHSANIRLKSSFNIGFDYKYPISEIYAPKEVLTTFRAFTADIDPKSQDFFVIIKDIEGKKERSNVLIPDMRNIEKKNRISHLMSWLIDLLQKTMEVKSDFDPKVQLSYLEKPKVPNLLSELEKTLETVCTDFESVRSKIDVEDPASTALGVKGFLEFFAREAKNNEEATNFFKDFSKWMSGRHGTIWKDLKDLNSQEQAKRICDLFIKDLSSEDLFKDVPTLFALKAMTFSAFAKAGEALKLAYPLSVDQRKTGCYDIAAFPKEQRFEITQRRHYVLLHEGDVQKIVAEAAVEWTLKASYDGKNFEASPIKFTDFQFTEFSKTLTMIDFIKYLKLMGLIASSGVRRSWSFR